MTLHIVIELQHFIFITEKEQIIHRTTNIGLKSQILKSQLPVQYLLDQDIFCLNSQIVDRGHGRTSLLLHWINYYKSRRMFVYVRVRIKKQVALTPTGVHVQNCEYEIETRCEIESPQCSNAQNALQLQRCFFSLTMFFQPYYNNFSLNHREVKALRNARSLSCPYPLQRYTPMHEDNHNCSTKGWFIR